MTKQVWRRVEGGLAGLGAALTELEIGPEIEARRQSETERLAAEHAEQDRKRRRSEARARQREHQ